MSPETSLYQCSMIQKKCLCVNIQMYLTYSISLIERHSKISTTGECSLSDSSLSTGWKLFKKDGRTPSGSLSECAGALRLRESCVNVLCGAWHTVGTLQTEAA